MSEKTDHVPVSERVRVSRLRSRAKAGLPLAPEEAVDLHEYEKARAESTGASRSASRRVSYTEEEQAAEAEGTGLGAEAAAAGAMVREEGRRLDSILQIGVAALQRSNDVYHQMVTALLKRTENFEDSQVKMLTAMREHFLGRVQAEADLMNAGQEEKEDPTQKMISEMLPMLLPQIMAAMAGGAKKTP